MFININKKSIFAVLTGIILSVVLCFVFTACNKEENVETVQVTDMGNNNVQVNSPSKRIIDLWPDHANSFFLFGGGDLLCGIATNDSNYINPWVEFFYGGAKNIKCFNDIAPEADDLLSQNPDYVIIHPQYANTDYEKNLRSKGLKVLNLSYNNYDEMEKSYKILAKTLNGETASRVNNWADNLKEKIGDRQTILGNVNNSKLTTPLVHYIPGKSDSVLATLSGNSIVREWIELGHAEYLSAKLNLDKDSNLKPKDLVDADYFFVSGPYKNKILEELNTSDIWKTYKAVQNYHIVSVPVGVSAWSGLSLESTLMIDYSIWKLQEEIATGMGINESTMIQKARDFYKDISGKDLNENQIRYMFDGKGPNGKDIEAKLKNSD